MVVVHKMTECRIGRSVDLSKSDSVRSWIAQLQGSMLPRVIIGMSRAHFSPA